MATLKEIPVDGYEKVVEVIDTEAKLHGFIAIHSTLLGPSLGGLRIRPYSSRQEALDDALRLSKAMSYKSALAEIALGGGKSVIIADPKRDKSPALFHSFGEALNALKGKYYAAEDIGSTTSDMLLIRETSPFVAALPLEKSSGDPSRFTAFGILKGMHAVAETLWGSPSLEGKTIAIQGLGSVGEKLAHFLFWEGAELLLNDIDPVVEKKLANFLGASTVTCEEILSTPCDIFAPCALGGILNKESIPQLRCSAVAGSANNQLATEEDGKRLMEKGILYAPDFAINAGGIINASLEFLPEGYDPNHARRLTAKIYQTLMKIFEKSQREKQPPNVIANDLAEFRLHDKNHCTFTH